MDRYATKSSLAMTQVILELADQNILQEVGEKYPSFISKLFLRKKRDGSMRPIFDLRELNKYVKTKHFHLISHTDVPDFLQPGDWMIKIDISQAYFHVPIAKSHRRFLRISYQNRIYEMTCLPFGLASAPHLFSSITCWVAETLRAKDCRVLVYLDDFLLVHQDRTKLGFQAAEAVRHLEQLGWKVNFQKSVLTPTQDLEYLGIRWLTDKNKMVLPNQKVSSINSALEHITKKQHMSLRQLQTILGQLNFASFVIPRGRLQCRNSQIFLRRFDKRLPRQVHRVPQNVYREMMWWRGATHHSLPIHKKPATHFLATDASDVGWGAQLDGKIMSGSWSLYQKRWHSNKKELFAVFAAIKMNLKALEKSHVLIQSDNRTLIAYIRKEGGTKSVALLELTFKLLQLADKFEITLSAYYLPGRYNIIADRLSRGKNPAEWHLIHIATEKIFQKWGHPEIDLFASKNTAVVRNYVSIDCKDRSACYTDAFSRPWNYRIAWVFPPPSLLPRVLTHLNNAKGTCSGPRLASGVLATGPEIEGSRTTTRATESLGSAYRCDDVATSSTSAEISTESLENWGWGEQIKNWAVEEKELLRKSWRQSTLTTYFPAIKRWLTWCASSRVNPKTPQSTDIARFLIHLFLKENLAYSTILVHKSAIMTFCGPHVEQPTFSDFFIEHVLKAIGTVKPKAIKRPFTWDPRIVLNWLSANPSKNTLFDLSRRTAAVLLLASGRRIHDLTLLKISTESFQDNGDSIILIPAFGSKTDTHSYRQSPWKLSKHDDQNICPVTLVKALITHKLGG
ncbi:uncharacterized protein LOC124542139 [Vanessa cardui]|uniref:uncharacterized protein LOC124542139 n=1 Tax=Vanessa cardui TaxID=171605 RepID=UPI001F144D84|nr:uncharacterized protein LOC124542139 [Vanessa cardui]